MLTHALQNNLDDGYHPVHLHGHAPQIVSRTITPTPGGAVVSASGVDHSLTNPMRRDTFMLAPNGATTIRFKADNPGVWLLVSWIPTSSVDTDR